MNVTPNRLRLLVTVLFGIALALVGLAPARAAGTVSITSLGTPVTENFDSLASSGTSTSLPTGWELSEAGTNANATYTAGTGSSNAGDTYSFGAAASTERAFGGLQSGSLNPTIGASFTNSTGVTITQLTISYTGEQWRAGVTNRGAADRLDFQLSTDATSLTTGTWIDFDSLDFNSPNIAATAGALDGNAPGNKADISFAISGLNIPNGTVFWVRWSDFNIASSDDGLSIDNFSLTADAQGGPDAAPSVLSTTPANGAADFAIDGNLSVTFSEPVDVAAGWYDLTCTVSGAPVAVTVTGGPTTFTLDPNVDLVDGETCVMTIFADKVTDQDTNDPPDNLEGDTVVTFTPFDVCLTSYTPAYAIQGSGPSAAITGAVTTQGVVVGDYEGASPALRGFYLQDVAGDGDSATSDGIFVFNGNNDVVSIGDVVRVSGSAGEFQGQTQISSSSVVPCGTGTAAPVDISFPVPSADYLEQFEGMLVRIPQPMVVTEHFQLGRFGQVVMSGDARLQQPTNVVLPGAPALALQAANNLNKIIVDDALNNQNPDPILFGRGGNPLSASNTLRGGDTATGMVGVMTYTWAGNSASGNAYRLRPVNALGGGVPDFQAANPRPTSAPAPAGDVRVASMNLLNYFNTFDGLPDTVDNCTLGVGGAPTDCRGADDLAEFDRQWPKTVAAMVNTQADVMGIVEIENDGYGPDSAIQQLVDVLNAATAPGTYAFIDADAGTGQTNALGTDAIKVGLIYKPASVTPVGTTAALNTVSFVTGGDSADRNRPALAQAFAEVGTGARFVVAVNHLKSKGSVCDLPDALDGQGNCNAVRVAAASELAAWLATDPTGSGDPDVLITGDLNSYAMEDPITALQGAGYTNMIASLLGPDAYSYVFDGQWGYLDHALANASLKPQVVNVTTYHINADEPSVLDYNTNFKSAGQIISLYDDDEFRISDHDPILVDINLNEGPVCTSAAPSVSTLWPPNHKFVPVDVLGVTDPENDPFSIVVTGIFQDEAVNGLGDGDSSPDGMGLGTSTAEIRAERDATADGRVYHIFFTASNDQGFCSAELLVGVPKKVNGTAIDGGALNDSTLP